MLRESLNDLAAFIAVARAGSFTRAAAQLGISQPALSQTVRALEARLEVRLLARTTRSVAPTEAGARLLEAVGPRFDAIEAGLTTLAGLRDRPAGTVRITATEHAANAVLWPALRRLLPDYPDIAVEIVVDSGLTDIIAQRIDAGVRFGGMVAKDMTAVRIGPDMRMAVVGSPAYLQAHPKPESPQDLTGHRCINLRLPTRGGLYAWEFDRDGHELRVWVEGRLTFNTTALILAAALDGFGLAYLPETLVRTHLEQGTLVRVLDAWCEPFSGYHLYFASHRQVPPALGVLVEALRWPPAC